VGTAVPTYLPHFSLLYTGTSVGAAEAPAPLPHLSFIMRSAGSFASARNPAPFPSLSSLLGGTSSYNLPITTGVYTITGGNVEADYQMALVKGTYTFTGVAVGLKRGATLLMQPGSYGINGQAVQLRRGLTMAVGTGTYTIAGQAVQLVYSTAKTIFLATGNYTISSVGIQFRRNYVLTCGPGSYVIGAQNLNLSYIEVQHYIVPYLIGATEDAARVMIDQIHGTAVVIGSGGTVVAQFPDFMQVVLKGQVVTITMGGVINHSRSGRRMGLPPYTRGCN
jgi:hypothetical protein